MCAALAVVQNHLYRHCAKAVIFSWIIGDAKTQNESGSLMLFEFWESLGAENFSHEQSQQRRRCSTPKKEVESRKNDFHRGDSPTQVFEGDLSRLLHKS